MTNLDEISNNSGWDIFRDVDLLPAKDFITEDGQRSVKDRTINFVIPESVKKVTEGKISNIIDSFGHEITVSFVFPSSGNIEIGTVIDPMSAIMTEPFYATCPLLKWTAENVYSDEEKAQIAEDDEKVENGEMTVEEYEANWGDRAVFLGGLLHFVKKGNIKISIELADPTRYIVAEKNETTGEIEYKSWEDKVNMEGVATIELTITDPTCEVEEGESGEETAATYTWVDTNEDCAQEVTTDAESGLNVKVNCGDMVYNGSIEGDILSVVVDGVKHTFKKAE